MKKQVSMRGGVSYMAERYKKTNSQYMLLHDESKSSIYIHV